MSPALLTWAGYGGAETGLLGKVPSPPSSVLPKSSLQDYFIDLWDLSLKRIASCFFDLSYHQETDLRVIGVCMSGAGGSCVSSAWDGAMWRHPSIEWVVPVHSVFTRPLVVFMSPTVHRVLSYPLLPLSLL